MNKLSKTSLDFAPSKMHIKMQTLWSLKQSSWSKDHLTVQNPICEGDVLQAVLYFTSNYQHKLLQKIVCFWRFRLQKDRVHDTSYRLLTLGRWGKNQLDHSSLKKNNYLIIVTLCQWAVTFLLSWNVTQDMSGTLTCFQPESTLVCHFKVSAATPEMANGTFSLACHFS